MAVLFLFHATLSSLKGETTPIDQAFHDKAKVKKNHKKFVLPLILIVILLYLRPQLKQTMSKHTTKASILRSAPRMLVLVILLTFVYNQSIKFLTTTNAQIEFVSDESSDKEELEDNLILFVPSLHGLNSILPLSQCAHCKYHDHFLVKTYSYELPSPPPELC